MFNFFRPLYTVVTYTYNVWSPKGIVDEFAAPVMRDFFPNEWEDLQEWTKSGASVAEVIRIFDEVRSGNQNEDIEIINEDEFFLQNAMKKVRARLGDWKVEPQALDDAIERLHLDTSAGYGYKGKSKGDVIDQIIAQAKQLEIDAKSHTPVVPLPCLLGTRGALHKLGDTKRRITYNVPAAQVLLEQTFVGPLTDVMKTQDKYPILFGKNIIPRLSDMNSKLLYQKSAYSCELDVSKFDRNVSSAILVHAFTILEDMFDFTCWKGKPLGKAQEKRWKRVWDYCKFYFLHTPVMTPDGRVCFLDGAIPSGSSFTQLIGSIVSMIMFEFYGYKSGTCIIDLWALGDDCRGVVVERPDLERIAKIYLSVFSAVVNVKKTRVVRADLAGSNFLGYKFKNGFLYRDSFEWFNLMLHPENVVKDLQTSFSRLTAYMLLGGVNDVKFSRFYVKYQTCYPIENWEFVTTKDIKAKRMYGGLDMGVKRLLEYSFSEFVWALITYKD